MHLQAPPPSGLVQGSAPLRVLCKGFYQQQDERDLVLQSAQVDGSAAQHIRHQQGG